MFFLFVVLFKTMKIYDEKCCTWKNASSYDYVTSQIEGSGMPETSLEIKVLK